MNSPEPIRLEDIARMAQQVAYEHGVPAENLPGFTPKSSHCPGCNADVDEQHASDCPSWAEMRNPSPDNTELRRALRALAGKWETEDHVEPGSYFADQLRKVLGLSREIPSRNKDLTELRRALWTLADKWYAESKKNQPQWGDRYDMALAACAKELREALTYPAATEADEQRLIQAFGKTSAQLAEEAERGYDV